MFKRSNPRLCGLLLALGLTLIALLPATGVQAQTAQAPGSTVTLPATLTEAEFQVLLARLSDEQVRDILITEFATRRAAEAASSAGMAGMMSSTRDIGDTLTANAAALLAKLPELGAGIGAIPARLAAAGGVGLGLLALMVSVVAGGAVRYFWRQRISTQQAVVAQRNIDKGSYGSVRTILDAGFFLLLELSGVLAFAVTAMATLYLLFHHPDIRLFASGYIAVVTVVMIVRAAAEFMFPRDWPIYRLVALSDTATARVHGVLAALAGLWMFETVTADLMAQFGAPEGTPNLWTLLLGVVWITLALAGTWWVYRATVDLLPPPDDRSVMAALTRNWAAITSVLFLCVWAVFTLGGLINGNVDVVAGKIFVTYLTVVGFWIGYRILVHYLRAQDMDDRVRAAIGTSARGLIIAAGLISVLAIWRLDPETLAASGPAGRNLRTVISVVLTAIVGWAIWDFIRTIIDVRVASETRPGMPEGDRDEVIGGEAATRTATLLPLLRATALVVIAMTCLFAILTSLGVNVGPLIAGAGVVGLAVGFGAQTLVKDVVSGIFFLFDDAFRLNEYIDVGGASGAVERISLRSITLRDSKGPVLIIPYGEIKNVTNFGRDWGIMKLKFTLPFDTDIEQVRKIFKRIGQEMLVDPELGPYFIEPFKSQGVAEFNDYGVVVRAKFTHKPGKQFEIRKRAFTRVKEEFDKAGIQFARREVKVNLGEGGASLTDDQARRVAAAAAETVAQADADMAAKAAGAAV